MVQIEEILSNELVVFSKELIVKTNNELTLKNPKKGTLTFVFKNLINKKFIHPGVSINRRCITLNYDQNNKSLTEVVNFLNKQTKNKVTIVVDQNDKIYYVSSSYIFYDELIKRI